MAKKTDKQVGPFESLVQTYEKRIKDVTQVILQDMLRDYTVAYKTAKADYKKSQKSVTKLVKEARKPGANPELARAIPKSFYFYFDNKSVNLYDLRDDAPNYFDIGSEAWNTVFDALIHRELCTYLEDVIHDLKVDTKGLKMGRSVPTLDALTDHSPEDIDNLIQRKESQLKQHAAELKPVRKPQPKQHVASKKKQQTW